MLRMGPALSPLGRGITRVGLTIPLRRSGPLPPRIDSAVPGGFTLPRDEAGEDAVEARKRKNYDELRSARWYGSADLRSFGHRSRTKQMGLSAEDYAGKPVIGILNTWSEMNPCHLHFRDRAEAVKRGVWQAGGFPVEMPALALGEPFMKPSTMMYRNLGAMEAEELLRANPIDGVVLMGGCDKTVPSLVMGALSMNLPAIFVPAGPMLKGHWQGKELGSGSDVWKYWAELRAGNIDDQDWQGIE